MFFLFMLLVLSTLVFFLVCHGQFGPQTLARAARRRAKPRRSWPAFHRGDISSEEFMDGPACSTRPREVTPGRSGRERRRGS